MISSVLAAQFQLSELDENSSSSILLDLYYYTVQFAMDNDFNQEQLSAFFSIVKKTHEVCSGEFCQPFLFLVSSKIQNLAMWENSKRKIALASCNTSDLLYCVGSEKTSFFF